MIPITQADLDTAATMLEVTKAVRESIDGTKQVLGNAYTPRELAIWRAGGRAVADFVENVARLTIAAGEMDKAAGR